MAKIKKFTLTKITNNIPDGKEPIALVEEFLKRKGYDSNECLQLKDNTTISWAVPINDDDELEITLEKTNQADLTTIYMGINILTIPLKYTSTFLASALTVADTLIGTKISIVDYDLVLSATYYINNMSLDDLNYFFDLLCDQQDGVKQAIVDGMKIEV